MSAAHRRSPIGWASARHFTKLPSMSDLDRAVDILRAGGLVAFPTETVYGIAAAATVPAAVERLYALKGRPRNKPTAIMVADAAEVLRRCPGVPAAAERLMERFWPGPLTVLL